MGFTLITPFIHAVPLKNPRYVQRPTSNGQVKSPWHCIEICEGNSRELEGGQTERDKSKR